MKKFPIGIQTFRNLINENYCYVDDIKLETLLFQTGYLTIHRFDQIGAFRRYDLKIGSA